MPRCDCYFSGCRTIVWEAVTAIGTIFTGLVILATVLLGARQLRATNDQLEQLRRATQLDGTMRIFELLRSHEVQTAQHFVFTELEERLKDDDYRKIAERPGGVDPDVHKERVILSTFEEIGTYVKHSFLTGDVIYDLCGAIIIGSWRRLAGLIAIQRKHFGDDILWSNFEFLYRGAKAWEDEHCPEDKTST